MQGMPSGSMTAVRLPESQALALAAEVSPEVSVACVNGPESCVLAGPPRPIDRVEALFRSRKIGFRRLNVSHDEDKRDSSFYNFNFNFSFSFFVFRHSRSSRRLVFHR